MLCSWTIVSHHWRQRPWRKLPTMTQQGGEGRFWGAVRGDQKEAVRHLHNSGGGEGASFCFPPFLPSGLPLGMGWDTHTHRVTQLFHESVVRTILHLFLDPKASPHEPSLTYWAWVWVCASRQCHLARVVLCLASPTVSV